MIIKKTFQNLLKDCIINNQWFRVTCVILHNFQNTNLQSSLEKSVLCNFQIEASLNQHSKPGKLIQIILWLITSNLERLILFCVIYRKQIQRFCRQRQLLSTLSLIINIKKWKIEKNTNSKHFCKHLSGILGEFT